MRSWARELLGAMKPVAALLNKAGARTDYLQALDRQIDKIEESALTPSARILADLQDNDLSFFEFAMSLARQHQHYFRARPLEAEREALYREWSQRSIADQHAIEEANAHTAFEDYLHGYLDQ